ncbi:DUF1232 domain-containing protein [Salinimicrobium gaetbulicola]|uniref:DUF1232 domain-containing protein n=1 Tax=Salinimicrobium gaetbulicola TaxID=999702 RepID=A0ABW3II53_9FLAO
MLEDAKKKINEDYVNSEVSKIKDDDIDMVMTNKEAIDKKFAGSGLKKYSEMGKIMFGMLQDYKKGNFKQVPWFTIGAIGFALLYVFNPLDMVPDFIPGLGYIDDFAIFTIVIRFIETDLHSYLDWKIDEARSA